MPEEIVRLPPGVCVVRSTQTAQGASQLSYSVSIARETVGARQLAMSLVSVPPGGAARPHYHLARETIIYVLAGRAETRYGQHLSQSVTNGPGDFIFIGANVPHAPQNLSDTERSIAINARSDPSLQEPVVPIDPSETLEVNWHEQSLVTVCARTTAPSVVTVGAKHLSLERLSFAPHANHRSPIKPHAEMGIYLIQGRLETKFGDGLQHAITIAPGEFLFAPMGVAYQLSNVSGDETVAVLARSGDGDDEPGR